MCADKSSSKRDKSGKADKPSKGREAGPAEQMNTGLSPEIRERFSAALGDVLDDAYSLMVHTHVYHWNVRGRLFEPLHKLLQEHYEALFEAVDEIAERVRQLGHQVPFGNVKFPSGLDIPTPMPAELTMVEDLLARHETVVRKLRPLSTDADDEHDYVTQDLVNKLLAFHEKAAWMLRSIVNRANERS